MRVTYYANYIYRLVLSISPSVLESIDMGGSASHQLAEFTNLFWSERSACASGQHSGVVVGFQIFAWAPKKK